MLGFIGFYCIVSAAFQFIIYQSSCRLVIPGGGWRAAPLTKGEALVFMDKLAKLELAGATDGPIKLAWEDAFLDALHHLCSTPDPPLAEVTSQRLAHRPVQPFIPSDFPTPNAVPREAITSV